MPTRAFWFLGLLWALGCGGGDDGTGGTPRVSATDPDGGRGMRECIDEDGDGWGRNCEMGADCDDNDPEVTDECRRCVKPNKGCPCEPGTAPEIGCKPPSMRGTKDGVAGTYVCSEGTRYCREGVWTECEFIKQYTTFIPD